MSSVDFVPNSEQLHQSVLMLQALRDPSRSDHQMAVKSIETHLLVPEFILNMLHVFSRGALYEDMGLTFDLRQLAGLIIKNYVFPNLQKLPVHVQQILKKEVVNVLSDVNSDIRKTAAILAGKISESFPVAIWCDMLGPIFQMLDVSLYASHPTAVDGSLQAVKRICEDSCLKLSLDDVNRPLDVLIPKLIALFACPEASIRIRALESYNSLLYLLDVDNASAHRDSFDDVYSEYSTDSVNGSGKSNGGVSSSFKNGSHPLVIHMNVFIQAIAALSGDANAEVRRCVCQAITIIASMHVAALDPYFASIAQFMLTAMLDPEENVAIESCEFWTVLLQSADTKRAMLPHLRGVIENLISRLYLSADQMEQERIDEEEESSGEKELNLRPMHHRASASSGGGGNSSEDSAKEESELSAKWTLRKQAALTLDNVALSFPPTDVLSFALPKIQETFQSGDVLVKESGMLALGALSSGCLDDMTVYIPQLFPFLVQNLLDPLPEMRSISCWVLSRYCALFECNNGDAALGGGFYEQTLQALIATMFDAKPKVQVAACSALCIVIENSFYAPQSAAPDASEVNLVSLYISPLLQAINKAFLVYGVKSSLILIDSIGTLADTVGQDLRNPAYTALYLPQLIAKYNELDDFDMRMFPVLECFTSLLSVLGLEAQSYVQHIYQRSLRMLIAVVKPAANHDEDDEQPCRDFAICALDVISALSEGLGELFPTLVADSRDALLECMMLSMNDELSELRQSGFSLSGEICKNSFQLITPAVAVSILELAVTNLDVEFPLVCNNAAWTVGELSLQAGGEFMLSYVPRVMQALIMALQQPEDCLEDNLKINIAVTIGRLGMVNTADVALLADEFFADWCSMLTLSCPLGEKSQAFTGLLAVLNHNPNIVLGNKTNIYSFVTACCAAWVDESEPPLSIMTGLREVLIAVRNHNPSLWSKVMSKFEPQQVHVLGQMFGL